jgi:hypothetical protein
MIRLPTSGRVLEPYDLRGTPIAIRYGPRRFNRIAIAAAHVVADPFAPAEPSCSAAIDWDLTLSYRQQLLDQGFAIAEAMDTAQRGMGLGWPLAMELIRRSLSAAGQRAGLIYSGCGTEQLPAEQRATLDDVVRAYLEQLHAIQRAGGRVVLMASRALARIAGSPRDYESVYERVVAEADRPVILHWLGEMFDPQLKGYWGGDDFDQAAETVLRIINAHSARIDGIKISLLDDSKEVALRRRLPESVKMYTGDDFNYPDLIAGDATGHSHALLGILDPIAPAAALALERLAIGDTASFHAILAPTVPLSRLMFRTPTQYYKTGVVFLAWLNGFQNHFIMLGGQQSMRPLEYFADLFRLADQAGLLRDPGLAEHRMRQLLAIHGAGD